MILRLAQTVFFLLLSSSCVSAAPVVVQSLVVDFPANGRVIVQAREEAGKFPQMVFISEKKGEVLLLSSIEDKEKLLIPDAEGKVTAQPELRFRVIRSSGFPSPMVMSVGVGHGGSDNAFFLTIFGEVGGMILRLNDAPIFANIQGGYYLGYLNKRFGYGLAAWNFIWGNGMHESHYSKHKYEIEIYQLQGRRLQRTLRQVSRRQYSWDKSAESLRELGIRARDQRAGTPRIKDRLE